MSYLCVFTILMFFVVAPHFGNATGQGYTCKATVTLPRGFSSLSIRERASRSSRAVGTLMDGTVVTLDGVTRGEWRRGTNAWFSVHGVHNGYLPGGMLRMMEPRPLWCDNSNFN